MIGVMLIYLKVTICAECKNSLKRSKLPKYALANDLYVGDVPHELQGKKK